MYPFGCDAQTSLLDLFAFFKQSLQQAEWELASACVPQLVTPPGGHAEDVKNIIKAIISRPYKLKWRSVGTPHKLAWFWLQVLENCTEERVSKVTRMELEFLLLLEELGEEGIQETALKELHGVFLEGQSRPEGTGVSTATAACVESTLRTLLERRRPTLAQALARFLQASSPGGLSVSALQGPFIHHLLERLRGPDRSPAWAEEVCGVLGALPWGSERSGAAPPVPAPVLALCEELWGVRGGPLTEERVLSALLRPRSDALVGAYSATALRLQRDHLLRATPGLPVDLPEAERLVLSLCCHEDRQLAWKTIYFECLSSGKHFLEQVLVTGLDLIKREEFSWLEVLLKQEFQPLSRLLLLLGWTHCHSLRSAQSLLHTLHLQQPPANDSVLQEFANFLSSQLTVLEWCKLNHPAVSMESLVGQLHTLDHHSALYLLHTLTPLARLPENRVLALLQQLLPRQPGRDDVEGIRTADAAVHRNVVLFQGFCAMKYAVYALCLSTHKYSGCTQCTGAELQDADHGRTPAERYEQVFQHYLSEVQLYLEVVPALFRLELLENIFSLLFLSSADFLQPGQRDPASASASTSASTSTSPGAPTTPKSQKKTSDSGAPREEVVEEEEEEEEETVGKPVGLAAAAHSSYLDLGHLTRGCRGFLVDAGAMEGLLRLLKEGLEGLCVVGQEEGRAPPGEAEAAESLGCSVTPQTFGARLQRLTKRTAEARWRLQIVTSNQAAGSEKAFQSAGPACPTTPTLSRGSGSSLRRRRRRLGRRTSTERTNREANASASPPGGGGGGGGRGGGGGGDGGGGSEGDECPCGGPHSWLVPAMLAPPDSLLISCIQRGNFMEAQQVSQVFGLEGSECYGELGFMERYQEVLQELARVEQKMETQSLSPSSSSSEGGVASVGVASGGRSRLGSSGRSTLQAIGSAAAAGMAFYSISDIAERLLSTPTQPIPSLEEGYWLGRCPPDHPHQPAVQALLEELSPPAMAAFDLACCHCTLWKTSRQLLDTAERRLNASLEARGVRADPQLPRPGGIVGFPAVLQQVSKILNHTASNKGSPKTESSGEEPVDSSPFGCCIQEVLLSCQPTLTQEGLVSRLGLTQRLEQTVLTLTAATHNPDGLTGSALLAALMEQAGLKQAELDAHPVRSGMKHILRALDQLCPSDPDGTAASPDGTAASPDGTAASPPDYMRTFLDYVNTMAAVLVRSLSPEDQAEVKLGNPLLVLLQNPSQLLSHLLFDRQVSPERVRSLLQQASLHLSVEEVILQRCCEPMPIWSTHHSSGPQPPGPDPHPDPERLKPGEDTGGLFNVASMTSLLHQLLPDHMTTLGDPSPPPKPGSVDCSEASLDTSTSSSPLSPSSSPPSFSSSFSVSLSSSANVSSSSSSANNPTSSPVSFLLTSSTLAFLKSRCPLLAALACLSAAPRAGEASRAPPSGWSGIFRTGRKDQALDPEQVAREADALLREFPVLQAYLRAVAGPVLGPDAAAAAAAAEEGGGLGAALCGKPLVGLLLGGPQGAGAQAVALDAFRQALVTRDLGRALSLLGLYGRGGRQEGALRDRLLACAALEDGEEDGIRHLFRVKDPGLRARVALQALERWPLGACLELLEFCLNDPDTGPPLRADLEGRRTELDIYRWMLHLKPALPWATWQDLRNQSRKDSEKLFTIMLQHKEFELCGAWLQLFPVSDPLRLQLQTEHLLHLLDSGLTEEAHLLLEGVQDVGLEVCERALDRRPGFAACHFLADHLTLHFQSQVTPSRRRHIQALHLGSKVLLALPAEARQDYFPLLSEPLLILEQLLMNLKVEWAGVAVATLRALLPGPDAGVRLQDVDALLAGYARKALDFPYAPRERARSDSVLSLQDGLLQCPAQDSSYSCRPDSPADSTGSTPTHASSVSSAERDKDRASAGRSRRAEGQFQPPPHPPARRDWVPDTQQDSCMVCSRERFTMFNRRHHCRRCGRLVCQACSEHKMAIEGSGEEGARVCDQCYAFFHCDSDDELEEAEAVGSPGSGSGEDCVLTLPEVVQRQVRLSSRPSENQLLRSEFYFEQAPSAHLCVAILSLHSDQSECGQQLIGHCRALSRKLNHAEVDAGLLTDVMKRLLFSAKLMFVKDGRSHDLPLCDSFISKVDVLRILVRANYRPIPSLEDLLETPAVTRLRNQLLEAEHYQLAVEVSTKSGLDPSGVWHAWGMAFLKAGRLSAARERFSRVLKPPLDRNQLSPGPPLLQEIVQQLETTLRPRPSMPFSEDILASLRELEEVLSDPGAAERPDPPAPDPRLHQEALHYLTCYGTHLALVCFYMRHDRMRDALSHLLSKECPDEVFLDGVLQPSLERGALGALQGLLESLDPGLELCSRYLIASCQLLQRRRHFHTLYQLQKFMTDHVRAAMTCIRFFSHGAQSYTQLGEQQRWLVRAKEHLRTYLQEQQGRGSVARRRSPVSSFRKPMSSSDVSRHMSTVELQLEVTRFLHRCEAAASKAAAHSPVPKATGSPSAPPTLFGGTQMKAEVACRVMLGGKNIEEGFGIVYRIIQDFQLDAQAVYVRAGQRLARQRQYAAIRQLLKCVGESGTATKNDGDAIVLSCLSVAEKPPADAKELEVLISEIKSPENKVRFYSDHVRDEN
ncbi:zinc finger FYVE domain-containing protein 26 isoform X2 [Gadus chalcogrammus]|uniref:zinc finger FYVE domain-containing protein 26 isoform X2 n=1 Tax=Gadus chalcogrammus TaxID=1042646 RepID=UPI0024C32D7B|nr:zinc finger FYVE domain-containing protein 26 isoform X2 [Gadus chalcogrammus]